MPRKLISKPPLPPSFNGIPPKEIPPRRRGGKPKIIPLTEAEELNLPTVKVVREGGLRRDTLGRIIGGTPSKYATVEEKRDAANASVYKSQKLADIFKRDIAPLPNTINWERRLACKRNLKLFCETYMPNVFTLGWSDDQLRCLRKLSTVYLEGGQFALAMPRGGGKTSLCRGSILWGTAYAYRRFPYFVGATLPKAKQTLNFIRTYWYRSKALMEDFPEIAYPVRRLENRSGGARGQTYNFEITHIEWGIATVRYPSLIMTEEEIHEYGYATNDKDSIQYVPDAEGYITRSSGTRIVTSGIDGSIRGDAEVHPITLEALRPDLVLLDDIQKDQKANSPDACTKMVQLVDGAIQGLSAPGEHIAAIMPCTVIREDDVADYYLDPIKSPEWKGERCAMVLQWPEGITDYDITLDTEAGRLWNKYCDLYRQSYRERENFSLATEFYGNNREVMDKGFVVSWKDRYNKTNELSAQQHAMNLRLKGPATFPSEFQNLGRRLYLPGLMQITAKQLAEKVVATERYHVPPDCHHLAAFIDVQDEMLFYGVCGVSTDFDGVITDYGTYPQVASRHFRKTQVEGWSLLTTEFFKAYPQHRDKAIRTDDGRVRAPRDAKIYYALGQLVNRLMSLTFIRDDDLHTPMKIQRIGIDTRWGQASDAIKRFIRESGIPMLVPYYGQPFPITNKQLEEYERRPNWLFEDMINKHVREPKFVVRPNPDGMFYLACDVNRTKDFLFARLSSPLGASGSIALYNAPSEHHSMFAEEVCNSEYPEPVTARGRTKNMWQERENGADNEYLDISTGLMAMLSHLGASTKTSADDPGYAPRPKLRDVYQQKRR